MADEATAGEVAPGDKADVAISGGDKVDMSVREAARVLAQARQRSTPQAAPEPAPAPAEEESAEEADAAPPQEVTSEDQEVDPAPAEPPLDLPRSWTKEQSEHWAKLDRATQEFLIEHDRKASEAVRRSQNEAAEQRKTLDGERSKLEQARQQYEQALPALVQTLQQSIAGDFPDIQTMDDVQKMAREDWARYIAWDASQKKLAAIASEARAAQERQVHDASAKFSAFAKEQDKLFLERNPEFADQTKAAKLQSAAVNVLKDIGFTEDELARAWSGQEAISLRDHRLQSLIADGVRYREAKTAIKTAPAKPLPPVTRPGVAPAPNKGVNAQIKELETRLSRTTSQLAAARIAAEIQGLKRQASR